MMFNLGFVFSTFLCLELVNGGRLSTVASVARVVYNILDEASNFKEIFSQLDQGKSPDDDKLNKAFAVLSARIDSSKADIITNVMLQSKLELIDDALIAMHSSLIDLKEILLAKTKSEREQLERIFVHRFEEHDVIKHIRFLPDILEYKIPGTSSNLVDLFADNTRCNMTAISEFQHFYTKLLSDGISLDVVHILLTSNLTLNVTIEDWRIQIDMVSRVLDNQVKHCISKFSDYENEDIQAANDAVTLWTNNGNRYPWIKCDVMFLKPFGTFQFLYIKHTEDHLFWYRSDLNKIAIFYNKNETKRDPAILANATEKFKSAIQGMSDENAAKNVGIAVEDHLKVQGYSVKALVVFFEGGDFYSENLLFDEGMQCYNL